MTVTVDLVGQERDPRLAGIKTGAWLDAQQFPALRYAVPGIIPEGFTLLVGAPKIGKSWFMLNAGLAVASAGRAYGKLKIAGPQPVLGCWLEDSDRRAQDRCRKLLNGDPIPPLLSFLTTIEPTGLLATIEAWLAEQAEHTDPLVILDTLGRVMPPSMPGESAYQRDYRIGAELKRVIDARPGSSLVVVHHDRKADSADFIDAVSGTHGLAGAADTTIVLARNRHETVGLLKITGRDVREAEYAMTVVDGVDWVIDGDGLDQAAQKAAQVRSAVGLGDRAVEVLAYVNARPGENVTPARVDAALKMPDARQYLKRLAESGRITKIGRGAYGSLVDVSQVSQVSQRESLDSHTVLRGNGQRTNVTLVTDVTPTIGGSGDD